MDITLYYLVGWGAFLLLAGYFPAFIKNRTAARTTAWFIIVLTTFFSVYVTREAPALFRMVAIASLQLIAMKSIVLVETYAGKPRLNFVQWVAFAAGWFGMRPALFEQFMSKPLHQTGRLVLIGMSRILLGLSLLFASRYLENHGFNTFFLTKIIMLVGLSLILHFGILNLSAAFWRLFGVPVKELFIAPYQSKSLKEFWGKRWNLAFSEMTALVAYRPLKDRFGVKIAMFCSFLLSGLLHEIAISFPVNAGYGLPLSYFFIHGLVMLAESESAWVQKIIRHPGWSRIWVMGWLLVPMPLLFHSHFMEQVVTPLRELILNSAFRV